MLLSRWVTGHSVKDVKVKTTISDTKKVQSEIGTVAGFRSCQERGEEIEQPMKDVCYIFERGFDTVLPRGPSAI
jgi:hypothetical protein